MFINFYLIQIQRNLLRFTKVLCSQNETVLSTDVAVLINLNLFLFKIP